MNHTDTAKQQADDSWQIPPDSKAQRPVSSEMSKMATEQFFQSSQAQRSYTLAPLSSAPPVGGLPATQGLPVHPVQATQIGRPLTTQSMQATGYPAPVQYMRPSLGPSGQLPGSRPVQQPGWAAYAHQNTPYRSGLQQPAGPRMDGLMRGALRDPQARPPPASGSGQIAGVPNASYTAVGRPISYGPQGESAAAAAAGPRGLQSFAQIRPVGPMMSSQAYLQQANAQLQSLHAARGPPARLPSYLTPGGEGAASALAYARPAQPGPSTSTTLPNTSLSFQNAVHTGGMRPPMPLHPQGEAMAYRQVGRPPRFIAPPATGYIAPRKLLTPSLALPAPVPKPPQAFYVVNDRRVRKDFEGMEAPLYVLLRRWVQNNPTLLPEFPSKRAIDPKVFHRQELEVTEEDNSPPKIVPLLSMTPEYEDICYSTLAHWKDVRLYHTRKRRRFLEKHQQHLAAIIPEPAQDPDSQNRDTQGAEAKEMATNGLLTAELLGDEPQA